MNQEKRNNMETPEYPLFENAIKLAKFEIRRCKEKGEDYTGDLRDWEAQLAEFLSIKERLETYEKAVPVCDQCCRPITEPLEIVVVCTDCFDSHPEQLKEKTKEEEPITAEEILKTANTLVDSSRWTGKRHKEAIKFGFLNGVKFIEEYANQKK